MALSKINDKFPALYSAAHPLHAVWRIFCQTVVWLFYRRYEFSGLENLPRKGGVLLCANHPCSLVDAVIIQAICPRIIHPLARSGLFKNPVLRPILTLIQAIPVYRRQDNEQAAGQGNVTAERNIDTFDTCYKKLKAGRAILIFPEGVTHSDPKMRKFKTGAARMTLGALEQNGEAPTLLPIGLNYSDAGRFRSSVFVNIGAPIPINKNAGASPEEEVNQLTEEIKKALNQATLNLESWDDLDLLRRVERFFLFRSGRLRKRNLEQRFRVLKKLTEAQAILREKAPALMKRTVEGLIQFEELCRQAGVHDYHLAINYTPNLVAKFAIRSLITLLLALPLAIWGTLNSIVPYLLTGWLAVRISQDRYQYDTSKILLGMLFFGGFWGGQTAIINEIFGGSSAVIYALSLLPSAGIALFMNRERVRITDNVRVFFTFMFKKELRQLLEKKRTEVERELAELTRIANKKPGTT